MGSWHLSCTGKKVCQQGNTVRPLAAHLWSGRVVFVFIAPALEKAADTRFPDIHDGLFAVRISGGVFSGKGMGRQVVGLQQYVLKSGWACLPDEQSDVWAQRPLPCLFPDSGLCGSVS